MKQPRPAPPNDAPPGTLPLSGEVEWFSASLQVSSVNLIPANVTNLLGAPPTESQTKGVPLLRENGSIQRTPKFGRWCRTIKAAQSDEWDIAEVVRMLFQGLPESPQVWAEVAKEGKIRVSLGLSISSSSQDFLFDCELIQLLARRHASVWFDVYREMGNDDSGD